MKFIIISFALLLMTLSCTNSKNMNEEKLDSPIFVIRETPCFGMCPVYDMEIYENGRVKYTGKSFVDKVGKFTNTISSKDLQNLINKFIDANFFELKDEYTAEMTDLPTVFTTFRYEEKEKTVKNYHGAPEVLRELENELRNIANKKSGWKKIESAEKPENKPLME